MNKPTNITTLILKYPNRPDVIIPVTKATTEQIVEWINQAPDSTNRNLRKSMMHGFLYNMRPKTFLSMLSKYPRSSN